jgi:hypothetical protein
MRNVLRGQVKEDKPLIEVNGVFREVAARRGFFSDELLQRVFRDGTLAHIDAVPDDVKRVFVCAHDISPDWHMRMQAAFQEHCDASISKTINFPEEATREQVENIYQLAYELGCKGVTVYRNNCRSFQPMALKENSEQNGRSEANPGLGEATVMVTETGEAPDAKSDNPTSGVVPESPATAQPPATRKIEPMDLPEIVSGFRIRQMTPFGNMHVKITVDPRSERELEVFAQLGKGGDVANSDLEGLCRTASLWLRAGGSLTPLIKQWEGIGTSMSIPTRSGRIMSLPDGLACALKKYARAKERFGLRALLLGEIEPAELDNPHPAPHSPASAPVDRPVKPDNGGNGGDSKAAAKTTKTAVERRVEASATIPKSSSASATTRTQTPKARQADAGNGNGNGHDDDGIVVAVAELEDTDESIGVVEDFEVSTETTLLGPEVAERTEIDSDDSAVGLDVAGILSSVRHNHDAAQHYTVKCPECGQSLVIQEGCRKCRSCGWAAC